VPVFIFMNNKSVRALKISLFVMLILCMIIPSILSASEEKKVAILDFVNEGPYERLDYLKYLLPQVLISGLAGQDGIAVLKRHHLEALIGESELAQKGFLEEKPFTPEEADIIVEGSWAEQPKPGLAFEETPLLIKAIVREGLSKKILGKIEVIGKREEFARIQKELITGVLSAISGREYSVKEGKKTISSWEAAEHIGIGLAILKSIDDWALPASVKNLNKAIESFKRTIYLDPESPSLPYKKIAFCYSRLLFFADKESEAAAQALRESIKWHGYLIDKFWDDSIICPQAMQSLMKDYYSVGMGNRGRRLELSESGEKEFFKRLEQLMGPLIERHSPSVYIQRSLRIAADVTEHFLREYKYSIRLRRKLLNECLDFRCNWWSNSKTWEANVEFLLPLAIAGTIRKSGHVEEAIKELEAAAKRNQNSKYVCHIHSRIADLAFAPNLRKRRTNNYELAKKHFALAISSAERAKQGKNLCWGLALEFVGEKIIDDPSCSDSLRQKAFELNSEIVFGTEDGRLVANLPHFAGFLRRHADLYPPAKDMLAKLIEKEKTNYEAPLSDIHNQIVWKKPVWHWKRSLGRRDFASSAVFKEDDVIWIALTTSLPCISLWQFNLNACTVNYYADYTHVSKNIKITSIAKAGSRFFIGTTDGLLVLNEKKKWEMFTIKDGLPFSKVRCLAVDKNSCWIGCGTIREGNIYKGALCRYVWDTRSWKTYSMKSVPTSLAFSGDELWIGMWGEPIKKPIYKMKANPGKKQVYRMDKNTGKLCLVVNQLYICGTYGPAGYMQWRDIPVVFHDEKNSIWCATTQECLQIDKNTNKVIFKIDKYISDITKNKEGYWLASYSQNWAERDGRLTRVHDQGCIIFLGSEETYSIIVSDGLLGLDRIKAVYPHKQFIWVIDDDMKIYGLERSMLHMPDALLKQIASAYRMKNIDVRVAVELLEKLKKPLPKSAGLRLEIAGCYRHLLSMAKQGKKHRRNAYELEVSKKLEFYKAKCIKTFLEAYELDHGSKVVLEAIKSAEKNEHIKILDKK